MDSTINGKALPLFTTDDPTSERRDRSRAIVTGASGTVKLTTLFEMRQDGRYLIEMTSE